MKTRGWVTMWLLIMMTFCLLQVNIQKVNAATENTMYSDKYLKNGSFED